MERELSALRRENKRLKVRVSQLERLAGLDAPPSPASSENPWDVLGIPRGSDPVVVMQSFRNLSKKHHPDIPGGDRDLFERLVQARDTLLSPK